MFHPLYQVVHQSDQLSSQTPVHRQWMTTQQVSHYRWSQQVTHKVFPPHFTDSLYKTIHRDTHEVIKCSTRESISTFHIGWKLAKTQKTHPDLFCQARGFSEGGLTAITDKRSEARCPTSAQPNLSRRNTTQSSCASPSGGSEVALKRAEMTHLAVINRYMGGAFGWNDCICRLRMLELSLDWQCVG